MPLTSRLWLILPLTFAGLSVFAAENPRIHSKDIGQDHFVSGDKFGVDNNVAGDLFAAGGEVNLNSTVSGDVLAAGRQVTLRGEAQQNAYLTGAQISIVGRIERNLRAAGGAVTLQPGARINGSASIAGREVNILGDIAGYLMTSAERVYVNGVVNGDMRVAASNIELGPQARVTGKLLYISRNGLKRDPRAQVLGAIEQMQSPQRRESHLVGAGHWIWYIGLAVMVVAWLTLLPNVSRRCSEIATVQWGRSLLTGLLAFVLAPLMVIICLVTVIGIPIGLIVFLAMPVLLIIGYVTGVIAMGDALWHRFKPQQLDKGARTKGVLIALLLLAFVTAVPFFGAIVAMAVLFIGFGASLLTLSEGLRGRLQYT